MTPARNYLAPIGHGDCAPLIKIIEKVRADVLRDAANAAAKAVYAGRTNVPQPELDLAVGMIAAIRNLGDKA